MHRELLQAYHRELRWLRESAQDFGRAHPQFAARLGLQDGESREPHIERLLEGVAFLTARTACRVDAEYDRLAQDLAQAVAPDLLCPLPSGSLLQFKPLPTLQPRTRSVIPRHSALRYQLDDGRDLHFHTLREVELRPLALALLPPPSRADIACALQDAGAQGAPAELVHAQAVRVVLRTAPGRPLREAAGPTLDLQCCGPQAHWLWNFLSRPDLTLLTLSPDGGAARTVQREAALQPAGWADDEAMLPVDCALPSAVRLLREAQLWPQRFLALRLERLQQHLAGWGGDALELWWLAPEPGPAPALAAEDLRLFCCPAVGLARRRCEPIVPGPLQADYPLRLPEAGGGAPAIVAVDQVDFRSARGGTQRLLPLAGLHLGDTADEDAAAPTYAVRREPRWQGTTAGAGTQDAMDWCIAPALDLPTGDAGHDMLLVSVWTAQPVDGLQPDDARRWRLDEVAAVQGVAGVGAPVSAQGQPMLAADRLLRALHWRIDRFQALPPEAFAQQLKAWLGLFCRPQRLPGLLAVTLASSIRRVPAERVHVHARGWQLRAEVDARTAHDPAFGLWPQLLAAVIQRQLPGNAFVECLFLHEGQTVRQGLVWP
ncbi:type VI secretion system baseplate subunit TssF [Pseudacidovorax intermedius]|uniref:type VI secretion system baseplate subunit TssF n=1 Tax=Pseudacidovorax intermedius TaxID=433924 RepID=UPI0007347664|nr:type VI secretion system baseplate subunit TssF [Pseudacidovorax intermedius]